jgi:septal ring factor EnvC (AmiA/AmiB activator)
MDPTTGAPRPDEHTNTKPTLWIVLAGVLALAAVGLAIWAMTLKSDLNDAEDTVDQQSAQIAAQEQEVAEAKDAGAELVDDAKQAFADVSAQLDKAGDAAADAEGQANEVSAELEELEASANAAKGCAQSVIGAFGQVFDAPTVQEGVDQAVAQLEQIESPCQSALEG